MWEKIPTLLKTDTDTHTVTQHAEERRETSVVVKDANKTNCERTLNKPKKQKSEICLRVSFFFFILLLYFLLLFFHSFNNLDD